MAKSRVSIPKAIRERVLSEFRHRCAICGGDRPHLHHIDEDPGNSDPRNLLPLCPNCHLVDQHDPTATIDVAKLALFRRYKDPVILSAQFHPLFRRLSYLLDLDLPRSHDELTQLAVELVAFVNALKMGAFYHVRIAELVTDSSIAFLAIGEPDHIWKERSGRRTQDFLEKLRINGEKAIDLIVEMLRYQDWNGPHAIADPRSPGGRSDRTA